MNNSNNQSARQSYDQAKQVLFDAWIDQFVDANGGDRAKAAKACRAWVDGRKFSQNEVRSEVELNNNNNVFTFGVTIMQPNSQGLIFRTEKRLNQQDSLIVSEYAIYVAKPASRDDSNYKLRTYGNPVDFTAAQALGIDGEFYSNGYLTMKVNNDVIIPQRLLSNHHYRGQTQQTAALGAGSPDDQFRGAEDGAITQEPNLLLIGSKNYIPQIILNNNLAVDMGFTRAIIKWTGVLAQNSTVIS